MIAVREDPMPLPEELENSEFFLEWSVPLECGAEENQEE
jgi:hypothetical protein